jgi:hypothetical protein
MEEAIQLYDQCDTCSVPSKRGQHRLPAESKLLAPYRCVHMLFELFSLDR